jgi:hypothetical protein
VLLQLTYGAGAAAVLLIVVLSARRSGLWRSRRRPQDRDLPRRRRRSTLQRRLRAAGILVGALAVVGVIAEGALVARAVAHVRRGTTVLAQAQSVLGDTPASWTRDHVSTADILSQEAGDELQQGYAELRGDVGLGVARRLPWIGEQVNAAMDGTALAVAAKDGFRDVVSVARVVDESRTSKAAPGARVLDLLAASAGPWADADARITPALARVDADSRRGVATPLASLLGRERATAQALVDEARIGAIASRFGAPALGASQPQSYLVLLPNPSELRPAGGFSGALGTTVMTGGAPASIEVKNQEDFNPQLKKKVDVPVPLARYLKFYKNQLELGDAGWDPDFPTTARLSEDMYASATGKTVAGTVSVDPYAIAALLEVTGPIDVAGYGTFDSSNFFSRLNVIVNASSGPGTGKAALPPISKAALDKILNTPASSWPRLLTVMKTQAENRHIQAYFHNPALAEAAATVHFDGGMVAGPSDYLMVSDANVGATKGDYFVRKSMQVKTEVLDQQGVAVHQVDVTYDMPAAKDAEDRALNPGDGSYRDYVRFLVPQEAQVAGLTITSGGKQGEGGLDTITIIHDRKAVGAFVRVPRGTSSTISLVYEVPIKAGRDYQLYLQKQAGVPEILADIQVSYPGGLTRKTLALLSDQVLRLAW